MMSVATPAPLSPFSSSSRRPLPRLPAPKTSPVPQYMANKAAGKSKTPAATPGESKKSNNRFSLNMSFNKEKDENASSSKSKRASGEIKVNRAGLSASKSTAKKSTSMSTAPGLGKQKSLENLEPEAIVGIEILQKENYANYLHDINVDESVENDEAVQHALETLFVWDELDGRAFRRLSHEGITVKHLQSIRSFATPPRTENKAEYDENSPTESLLRQNGLDKSPLPPFPAALAFAPEAVDTETVSPRRRALREIQSGVVPVSSIPFAKHDKGSLTPPPPARAPSMAPSTNNSTPNQQDSTCDDAVSKKLDFPRLPPNSTNTTRRRSLGREAEAVTDTVLEALKEYLKRQHADLLIRKSPPQPPKKETNHYAPVADKSSKSTIVHAVNPPSSPARRRAGDDDLASQLRDMTLQLDEIIQKDFNIDCDGYEDAAEIRTAPQSPFDIVAKAVSPSSPSKISRAARDAGSTPCTPPQDVIRTPGRMITPKTMPEVRSTPRQSLDPNDWTEMCIPADVLHSEQSTPPGAPPAAPATNDSLSLASAADSIAVPVPPAGDMAKNIDPEDGAVVSVRPFGYGLHGYVVEALLYGYMTASVTERPQFEGEGRFVVDGQLFLEAAEEEEEERVEEEGSSRGPDIKVLVLKSFDEFVALAFDIDVNIDANVPEEFQERYLNRWLGDVLRAFRSRPQPPSSSNSNSSSSGAGAARWGGGSVPAHWSSRGTQAVILKDFFVPSHDSYD